MQGEPTLTAENGAPPEWIQLLPAGPDVIGRDGRKWRLEDAAAVVANTKLPLAVTYDHAGFFGGRDAPAAGWIEALEVRDGAVWGRVEWTAGGRAAVADKSYRFVSPEFVHDADPPRRVGKLLGASLTNGPNLDLAAVASRSRESRAASRGSQDPAPDKEEKTMKEILERVRAALGLQADAGEDAIVAACAELRGKAAAAQAGKTAGPPLDTHVPRADYDGAVARAAAAEQRLAEQAAASREAEIEAEIGAALEAGKIVPATADYHRAACRQEGGLERFRAFAAAAPEIAAAGKSAASAKPPQTAANAALDADRRRIFDSLGVTAEDVAKYRGLRAAA